VKGWCWSMADETAACPHGDPTCPCPDGDVCHYVDDPLSETLAMCDGSAVCLARIHLDYCRALMGPDQMEAS
jgi:hypothetical protein